MSQGSFGLMFNVKEGGDSVAIQWGKENLTDDRSIIVLDESSQAIWLWHGRKQGLVARRTALRQAESLKGHGYTVGKSIIGRDVKEIREIDQRKIGRDPETDEINEEFQAILGKTVKQLDNFVITFSMSGIDVGITKAEPSPEPIVEPAASKLPKPVVKLESTPATPVAKTEPAPEEVKTVAESPIEEARVSFVLKAVLEHYDDIWVSKKKDGSYAIEMMDGPLCQFTITEKGTIKFSANSFSGISQNIKTEIQKKYVELSKLI